MTSSSCATDIRNLIDALSSAGIVLDSNPVGVTGAGARLRVSWVGTTGALALWQNDSPSLAEYTTWLRNRQFSVVLRDGALLQVSFDFQREDLVGHRLVYIPCPFDFDPELLLEIPLLDLLEDFGPPSIGDIRLRSPVRFDFDPAAAAPGHAASHLTVVAGSCRVASAGPLSLGHFVRFVFRQFYPELWNTHPFLRQWAQASSNRTLLPDEESELHINWRDPLVSSPVSTAQT